MKKREGGIEGERGGGKEVGRDRRGKYRLEGGSVREFDSELERRKTKEEEKEDI